MLARLLLPATCVGCGLLLREAAPPLPLCTACAPEAVPLPAAARAQDGIGALFAYEGPLRSAVTRLKFGGQPALAGPLGRLLGGAPELERGPWDLLAPIPLHRSRALARGYDQAALLALWLHRSWPAGPRPRLAPRLLRRTRATAPQTDLDRRARAKNLRRAFVARAPKEAIAGRRILLIDDVTTTGATLAAGRAALYAAGAAEVVGLALLRALP
ncbi:MAG: ComF family protein [Myxococcales bacterium]|nr:ComF family protein [Myxococcales bacterium]